MFRNAFRWTDFYVVGFLTLVALPSEALAQVPNNSAVVSRFRLDGALMPDGGLTVVDLDNPANTADITGLSDDLAGPTWFSNYDIGANCVLLDERTGKLIVGEQCAPGDNLDIHRRLILVSTTAPPYFWLEGVTTERNSRPVWVSVPRHD